MAATPTDKAPEVSVTALSTGRSSQGKEGAVACEALQPIFKHAIDADDALKAFEDLDGEPLVLDPAAESRLRRKIDWHLLPIMCVVYGMTFLDKITISYASVMGLTTDLHLVGTNYSWLGGVFYVGYLVSAWPTSRLLQILPVSKMTGAFVMVWGVLLALVAVATNFPGAVALRLLLGVFEAVLMPAFVLITSRWYTLREQGLRTSCWLSFNGIAQIFGGLAAYGIARGSREGETTLPPWKTLFVMMGVITFSFGIIFLLVMPDSQLNARFLTKRERALAVERVRGNCQGIGNRHFKWYQLREALADPIVWAMTLFALAWTIPNGGITNFFNQMIISFGFTPEQSLLLSTPPGAFELVVILSSGWLGDHYGQRILVSQIGLILSVLGIVLIVVLPLENNAGRLAGYFLAKACASSFICLLAMIASNVAGYTKKTTAAAMFMIAYCTGSIIGPQLFRPADAPQYRPAEYGIIGCWVACILDLLFLWAYMRRENARKAAIRSEPGYQQLENQAFLDLTDRENPEFVYTL